MHQLQYLHCYPIPKIPISTCNESLRNQVNGRIACYPVTSVEVLCQLHSSTKPTPNNFTIRTSDLQQGTHMTHQAHAQLHSIAFLNIKLQTKVQHEVTLYSLCLHMAKASSGVVFC